MENFFLPAVGFRNWYFDGTNGLEGHRGYYWSSARNDGIGFALAFTSLGHVASEFTTNGHGVPIRCVR